MASTSHHILVAGATGFVGRALVPALIRAGHTVRSCARRVPESQPEGGPEVLRCDLLDPRSLAPALAGIDTAYYLVHSLAQRGRYRALDRRAAHAFAEAAAGAGVRRIVYLGGVAPSGRASPHLASRLEVGQILRAGPVPALELRASMIIGPGSASWQIVRDLALRLPAMVLPSWLDSRLRPIALDDAIRALVDALEVPLPASRAYDIPGPDTLTAREILEHIAAFDARKPPAVSLPWLTPKLSALWLRLVTRASYPIARELVLGLSSDLLPIDDSYWELTGHRPALSFDAAARRALSAEQPAPTDRRGQLAALEERLVRRLGARGGA